MESSKIKLLVCEINKNLLDLYYLAVLGMEGV